MPQEQRARVSFGGGEIDPRLTGRIDLPEYRNSMLLCENFFPTPMGGLRYRPGLRLRRVLENQRNHRRVKMIRARGYVGQNERIFLLDGSKYTGKIEAYSFPYAGNTRFTLTDSWTRSVNRPSFVPGQNPGTKNDIPGSIHEARVSNADLAGTILTHRDFPPLHIGSASITELATAAATVRYIFALDSTSQHLWQMSTATPDRSEDLGPMPPSFGRAAGMATDDRDVLAISGVRSRNTLWRVNRSNAGLSELIGILRDYAGDPIVPEATCLAVVPRAGDQPNQLFAITTDNSLWEVEHGTLRCRNRGTIPVSSDGATIHGMTFHDNDLLAVDSNGRFIDIFFGSPAPSYRAEGLPAGLMFTSATLQITGTPTTNGAGLITVIATNSTGSSTFRVPWVVVDPVAPSWAAAGGDAQTWGTGTAISPLTVPAVDTGAPVVYAASGLPAGLSFSAATRQITGTPTTAGTGTIRVTATNSVGGDTYVLAWRVASGSAPNFSSNTGTPLSLTASTYFYVEVPSPGGFPDPEYTIEHTSSSTLNTQSRWLRFDRASRVLHGVILLDATGTIRITARNVFGSDTWSVAYTAAGLPSRTVALRINGRGTSAEIAWFNGPIPAPTSGTSRFEFRYRRAGTSSWTESGILGTNEGSWTVSATPGQAYEAQARVQVGGGSPSSPHTPWGPWGPIARWYQLPTATSSGGTGIVAPSWAAAGGGAQEWARGTAIGPLTVPAVDAGGTPIVYAATGLPAGLSFSASTRQITGTPTTAGTGAIRVTATNSAGSDTYLVVWVVLAEPPQQPVPGAPSWSTPSMGLQEWPRGVAISALDIPAVRSGELATLASVASSTVRDTGIQLEITTPNPPNEPFVERFEPPKTIAADYRGHLLAIMHTDGFRSDALVSIPDTDTGLIDVQGYVPLNLLDATAMTTITVTVGSLDRLGNLFDEKVERTAEVPAANSEPKYFSPKHYLDHLGNWLGEGGYPGAAAVFLDRLVMGGSTFLPGTFIGSELYPRPASEIAGEGQLEDFSLSYFDGTLGPAIGQYAFYWLYYHPRKSGARDWADVNAQDSFLYKIPCERELIIRWIVPFNDVLVFGTSQGLWIGKDFAPDTPPNLTQYSNIPVGDVDPVVTDFGIAFADASLKEVHVANLGVGFEPPTRRNVIAHARHLTAGTTIRQLAWQSTPQRRLWMLTSHGTLAALCYEPEEVLGWFRVTNDRLSFCGVCTVPGEDVEVVCVLCYAQGAEGLTTLYLTTLDAEDHLDLGTGIRGDFTDDAIVPPADPAFGGVLPTGVFGGPGPDPPPVDPAPIQPPPEIPDDPEVEIVPDSLILGYDRSLAEGDRTPTTVTVYLNARAPRPILITFSFSGSATRNSDYTASATQISIPIGQSTGEITLRSIDDRVEAEGNEIVTIQARSTDPALTSNTIRVAIDDNDERVIADVVNFYASIDPAASFVFWDRTLSLDADVRTNYKGSEPINYAWSGRFQNPSPTNARRTTYTPPTHWEDFDQQDTISLRASIRGVANDTAAVTFPVLGTGTLGITGPTSVEAGKSISLSAGGVPTSTAYPVSYSWEITSGRSTAAGRRISSSGASVTLQGGSTTGGMTITCTARRAGRTVGTATHNVSITAATTTVADTTLTARIDPNSLTVDEGEAAAFSVTVDANYVGNNIYKWTLVPATRSAVGKAEISGSSTGATVAIRTHAHFHPFGVGAGLEQITVHCRVSRVNADRSIDKSVSVSATLGVQEYAW